LFEFPDVTGAVRIYIGDTGAFHLDNISAGMWNVSLEADEHITSFSETMIVLSGWQCPASPAVNPSG